MHQNKKILYVEDDETLSYLTIDNLKLNGYEVKHCLDGEKALEIFNKESFDICILDIMLPKLDGFTLAKEIRLTNEDIPIIFLTAKSLKEDKIHGLKIGADDYLTKPFSIEELILKIEVFLKRNKITYSKREITKYTLGRFTLDYHNYLLFGDDFEKKLTQKEANLIRLFAENPNKILKREEILKPIWGDDDYFMGRSLDVFISRLRKYLKSDPTVNIENIHGIGFRMKIS